MAGPVDAGGTQRHRSLSSATTTAVAANSMFVLLAVQCSLSLVLQGNVIPHSEIVGTKPPYVCPGCFIHTYSNNMITRFHA
jgi:hypothetical protein